MSRKNLTEESLPDSVRGFLRGRPEQPFERLDP
jgi:hypothetical protein